MVKKNKQSSFNLSFLFQSSVVINLLYLFIVLLLIKMIDVLGRTQQEHIEGTLLFYIYNNGKIEKKIK